VITTILVFARTPAAERVKTRLLKHMPAARAVRLHEAMIADTLDLVAALPLQAERVILFSDGIPPLPLPSGFVAMQQAGGNLGDRMAAAISAASAGGAGKVIVLGSDSPHLPPARLMEAAAALDAAPAVLGPAEDGGVYLIGLRDCCPAMFEDVEWGTARVFEQLRARLPGAIVLEPWYDLDEITDLRRLASEDFPTLRTAALARELMRGR